MERQLSLIPDLDSSEPDPFAAPPPELLKTTGLRLAITGHRFDKINAHNGVRVPTTTVPVPVIGSETEQSIIYHRLCNYAGLMLEDLWIKPDIVYSGMALGWDQAVAYACHQLRIPFMACVPFVGQEESWPAAAQTHYHWLLKQACQQVVVSTGNYAAWKYLARDKYMVDQGTHLACFWNGQPNGGTYETVLMARRKRIPIGNFWQPWARLIYKDETKVPHQVKIRETSEPRKPSNPREWRFF